MSWRYASNHQQETKEVKGVLLKAGLPIKSVGHSRGTAWGWLVINLGPNPSKLNHVKLGDVGGSPAWMCIGDCPACNRNRQLERQAVHLAQEFTGRHGDYDGNIQVLTQ